jgi:hypothetical protein
MKSPGFVVCCEGTKKYTEAGFCLDWLGWAYASQRANAEVSVADKLMVSG